MLKVTKIAFSVDRKSSCSSSPPYSNFDCPQSTRRRISLKLFVYRDLFPNRDRAVILSINIAYVVWGVFFILPFPATMAPRTTRSKKAAADAAMPVDPPTSNVRLGPPSSSSIRLGPPSSSVVPAPATLPASSPVLPRPTARYRAPPTTNADKDSLVAGYRTLFDKGFKQKDSVASATTDTEVMRTGIAFDATLVSDFLKTFLYSLLILLCRPISRRSWTKWRRFLLVPGSWTGLTLRRGHQSLRVPFDQHGA
jgi:hypothetical protein